MARGRGVWRNGNQTVTGEWCYNWAADNFTIWLDSVDEITGRRREITTSLDTPEWGKWKLVREEKCKN